MLTKIEKTGNNSDYKYFNDNYRLCTNITDSAGMRTL